MTVVARRHDPVAGRPATDNTDMVPPDYNGTDMSRCSMTVMCPVASQIVVTPHAQLMAQPTAAPGNAVAISWPVHILEYLRQAGTQGFNNRMIAMMMNVVMTIMMPVMVLGKSRRRKQPNAKHGYGEVSHCPSPWL